MATTNTKTKAEVVKASDTAVVAVAPSDELRAMLQDMADQVNVTDSDAGQAIIERILAADTVDDVWANTEAIHARDFLGRAMRLNGFTWQKSDYDDGPGAYAVLDAMDYQTGNKVVITCGARQVLAQLWKLRQLGVLPCDVSIQQTARPTDSGYFPLFLRPETVQPAVETAGEPF